MISWVADVLRSAGLKVVELDGWRTRGRPGGFTPVGIVWHHTATNASTSDAAVERLLRDGRPDLAGPLSQLGLRRDGTYVVVAAGRANHNGFGTWGNDSIGIEAYNDGVGEPWPQAQVDAYVRGTAAICRFLGWGADRVKAHRETDPTRKIDPTGIDMHAARVLVAALITKGPSMSDALTRTSAIHLTGRLIGLNAAEIKAVLDRGGDAIPADLSLRAIRADLARLRAEVAAIKPSIDEAKLAEEIARRLPSTSGPVRIDDLKEAVTSALIDLAATVGAAKP